MSLKQDNACGVYQTPSVASGHVLKERPECLKIGPNLEFSSASVMFIVTFEPENRVWGNDEHRITRLLDEHDRVAWSDFSLLVCARRGAGRSEMLSNPPLPSEIAPLFHRSFTSSDNQFSDVSPTNLAAAIKHVRVQNESVLECFDHSWRNCSLYFWSGDDFRKSILDFRHDNVFTTFSLALPMFIY